MKKLRKQQRQRADNEALRRAKAAKQDEFYTQYRDIQAEINEYYAFDRDVFRGKTILLPCDDPETSNFTRFFADKFEEYGLRRLISTSFAPKAKLEQYGIRTEPFLFDDNNKGYSFSKDEIEERKAINPNFDEKKHFTHGRVIILDHDWNGDGRVNWDDIKHCWTYLEGTGDFRSDEVKRLRDEADVIVTNPPFSLFREFMAWIMEAEKKFVIIGNKNAITYKEIFPHIKEDRIWIGATPMSRDILFDVPDETAKRYFENEKEGSKYKIVEGKIKGRSPSIWFTNVVHGTRYKPMQLMTMNDNLRFNKKISKVGYPRYDNYDAIEVGFTDGIPSDYEGVMGVPISFLGNYNPNQFSIVGCANHGQDNKYDLFAPFVDGRYIFKRILIRHKHPKTD